MSRHGARSRLTNQPARWVTYPSEPTTRDEYIVPCWYALPMPEPWDEYHWHQWPDAWAQIILDVADSVWTKQGAKLYAARRDHELKADLEDWLVVEAVEIANDFLPDPWHPNPHLQFAKFLHGGLNIKARYHFADVVGDGRTAPGKAAREAYQAGIASTEALDAAEAEGSRPVSRHPLHGADLMAANPPTVLIRMEELAEQIRQIERDDLRQGFYSTNSTAVGAVCLTNQCGGPIVARGLCRNHYALERKHAIDRGDWEAYRPAQGCKVDGCQGEHEGRGLCRAHLAAQRAKEAPPCAVEGCGDPAHSKGLCGYHYAKQRLAQKTDPCSVDDCTKIAQTRGMCPMHYQRWRKERARGAA